MTRALSISLLCALALGAGCQKDTVFAPGSPRVDELPAAGGHPKVTTEEPGWGNFLRIDVDSVVVVPDELLRVTVPIRYVGGGELIAQYQFEWFNDLGESVGKSSWRRQVLPNRREIRISGNAIRKAATDWRLYIRAAR